MKLTATPFNPQTGELLPVYRDAYLRGDLARTSVQAVETYLRHDADQAHSTVTRWHQLQTNEAAGAAPGWVNKQLLFIRQQPQRFRRRALSLAAVGALLAGASMAATSRPGVERSALSGLRTVPSGELVSSELASASLARTLVVHGRILNEKGQPLVGATVLRKGTASGTSTDANGNYALRVPAAGATTLQYGYGGYTDQELPAGQVAGAAVTLQPRAPKPHRWLFF